MSNPWEGGDRPNEQPEAKVELPSIEQVDAAAAETWPADIPAPAVASMAPETPPPEVPPPDAPPPETAEPPVEYGSVRDALLSNIDDQRLKNHASELYRSGAETGDGGTAAALYHEKDTGELVGGKSHADKAENRSNGLDKLLKPGELNPTDREIAKDLNEDLDMASAHQPRT